MYTKPFPKIKLNKKINSEHLIFFYTYFYNIKRIDKNTVTITKMYNDKYLYHKTILESDIDTFFFNIKKECIQNQQKSINIEMQKKEQAMLQENQQIQQRKNIMTIPTNTINIINQKKSKDGYIIKIGDLIAHKAEIQLVTDIEPTRAYPIRTKNIYNNNDVQEYKNVTKVIKILKHKVIANIKSIENNLLFITGTVNGTAFTTPYNNLSTVEEDIIKAYNKILANEKIIKEKQQIELDIETKGEELQPNLHILSEPQVVEINTSGSLLEKYTQISGSISELTQSINDDFQLLKGSNIEKSFNEAKTRISEITQTKPNKTSTIAGALAKKLPFAEKLFTSVKDTIDANSSVQKHINYLFGIISTEYDTLISVGERLQQSKSHMEAQVKELEIILPESEAIVNLFANLADVPMRELSLNSSIKSSIEKYKARLLKIDGAIIATQTTIIALGKDLPSMKSDLVDEMAISSILNNVGNYQSMYSDMATLVSEVTDSTAKKTHDVINNLFKIQINDTHTLEYMKKGADRSEKFATMVSKNTADLYTKVERDAKFINEIMSGSTIENARKTIKKIK